MLNHFLFHKYNKYRGLFLPYTSPPFMCIISFLYWLGNYDLVRYRIITPTWVSSVIVVLAAVRVIGRQMRAPQLCLQNVIAGDALILRKAPPAVHPADRRVVAGEVLLQPHKLPLRFYIQNTITEISVLCQQCLRYLCR